MEKIKFFFSCVFTPKLKRSILSVLKEMDEIVLVDILEGNI
ncbi:MAG: hypothetical protein WC578_05155 [Candidatus Omnitrophota bacterium]